MRRTITLVLGFVLASASLLPASPASGQGRERAAGARPGGPPRPGGPGGPGGPGAADSPALREALRDFYIHLLAEDLGLTREDATRVEPRVRGLLEAHRKAHRQRMEAAHPVMEAARAGDRAAAATALATLLEADEQGERQVALARDGVLSLLSPRQDALFLGFEGRFQQRIRRFLERGGQAGSPPGPAGSPPGHAERPGGAGPRPGGPPGPPPEDGDGEDHPFGEPGGEGSARDEWAETGKLIFTHRLRLELALDDAETLALLPDVDRLLDAKLTRDRARRARGRELQTEASDPSSSEADLTRLSSEMLAASRSEAAAVMSARRAVLARLDPLEGARFVGFEHRFDRQMRQRALGGLRREGMR